jgi:hypothetical protein
MQLGHSWAEPVALSGKETGSPQWGHLKSRKFSSVIMVFLGPQAGEIMRTFQLFANSFQLRRCGEKTEPAWFPDRLPVLRSTPALGLKNFPQVQWRQAGGD